MRQIGIEEIKKSLRTKWLGQNMIYLEETDSTNEQVHLLACEGAANGTIVVADRQTAGRGRRGRNWESPAGRNLYFSLLLRPQLPVEKVSMLTLVMAHAVAVTVQEILADAANAASLTGKTPSLTGQTENRTDTRTSMNLGIKWPNDIVIDGKKVCGILTELRMEKAGSLQSSKQSTEQEYYVIVGVGINVQKQAFLEELRDKATDLETVSGHIIDRNRILAELLNVFEKHYEEFCKAGDLSGLREQYEELLVNKGREVCVLEPSGEWKGVAEGITDTGELVVALPDGSTNQIYAGEVSVRGVYGYV